MPRARRSRRWRGCAGRWCAARRRRRCPLRTPSPAARASPVRGRTPQASTTRSASRASRRPARPRGPAAAPSAAHVPRTRHSVWTSTPSVVQVARSSATRPASSWRSIRRSPCWARTTWAPRCGERPGRGDAEQAAADHDRAARRAVRPRTGPGSRPWCGRRGRPSGSSSSGVEQAAQRRQHRVRAGGQHQRSYAIAAPSSQCTGPRRSRSMRTDPDAAPQRRPGAGRAMTSGAYRPAEDLGEQHPVVRARAAPRRGRVTRRAGSPSRRGEPDAREPAADHHHTLLFEVMSRACVAAVSRPHRLCFPGGTLPSAPGLGSVRLSSRPA